EALEQAYTLAGETGPAKLALAAACAHAKQFARVLNLLETDSEHSEDPQVLTLVASAFFAEKNLPKAEEFYWKLAQNASEPYDSLIEIAMEYTRNHNFTLAIPLLKKLEERLIAAKEQRRLMTIAEKLSPIVP